MNNTRKLSENPAVERKFKPLALITAICICIVPLFTVGLMSMLSEVYGMRLFMFWIVSVVLYFVWILYLRFGASVETKENTKKMFGEFGISVQFYIFWIIVISMGIVLIVDFIKTVIDKIRVVFPM